MQDQKFDNLTKAMATGTSRRLVLRGLAAGAVGALATVFGPGQSASAQPGCRREGHPCEGNQVCCPGLVCTPAAGPGQAARCTRPTPPSPTPPKCKSDKDTCSKNEECCSGCCKDGYCKDASYCKCKSEWWPCSKNEECCSGCCKDGCCRDASYCKY